VVCLEIPEIVRARALLRGEAGQVWIDALPAMIESLARDWDLEIGPILAGGTDALVTACHTSQGQDAVLKLVMPGLAAGNDQLRALLAFKGRGYVEVLRHDEPRNAMLLERLGPQLSELGLPISAQIEIICATLRETWTNSPEGHGFMTGAQKAESLAAFILDLWRELAGACSQRTIDIACDFAEARRAAFDPAACVLGHGDAHAANTLAVPGERGRFKFIDPDGLFIERAYDLAIPMREWGAELLDGDPAALGRRRCEQLAHLTGVEAEPIWQWGFIERVSTGLLLHQLGQGDEAREFLTVADAWAEAT
jgi:streptomycin 6-kinase